MHDVKSDSYFLVANYPEYIHVLELIRASQGTAVKIPSQSGEQPPSSQKQSTSFKILSGSATVLASVGHQSILVNFIRRYRKAESG